MLKYFVITGFVLQAVLSFSQLSHHEEKVKLEEADKLLLKEEYEAASVIYEELKASDPDEEDYRYRLGICHVELDGREKEGLEELLSITKPSKYNDFEFYFAEAKYLNFYFEEAIEHYTTFENSLSEDETFLRDYIELKINYCKNAIRVFADTVHVDKVNLGEPVNTPAHEYVPCITPDESMVVFTYKGERSKGGKMNRSLHPDEKHGRYYEDIFVSYRNEEDGTWSEPEPIDEVNTLGNEAAVGISHNGEHLFIFRSSLSNPGDLYESNFIDGKWTTPTLVKGMVNSQSWEGSATVSTNGKTMYFSSERPGGFGGKDLYSATLLEDGTWGRIANLGPEINTKNDEDDPFIHPDHRTLYYSSNGRHSIGGYDILVTKRFDNGRWASPGNAGYPFNTLKDDRAYYLTADAQTGYFSHPRGHGHNDHDIFTINTSQIGEPPILALITGSVFIDNSLEAAEVFVHDLETGELEGHSTAQSANHKFSMLLLPEKSYIITVVQEGVEIHRDTLDMHELKEFMRMQHDYNLYSDDFDGDRIEVDFNLQEHFNRKIHDVDEDHMSANQDSSIVVGYTTFINGNDTIDFKEIHNIVHANKEEFYNDNKHLAEADNVDIDHKGEIDEKHSLAPVIDPNEIQWRVQIGAYRKPKNFQYHGHTAYGDVEEQLYEDGLTRFTIGGTRHLEESKALRLKLIEYGFTDSFIVKFKGGKRALKADWHEN